MICRAYPLTTTFCGFCPIMRKDNWRSAVYNKNGWVTRPPDPPPPPASTLQFINCFQSGSFMPRHWTLLFHQSNWTAEIRARVLAQSWRPWISHAGGGVAGSVWISPLPSRNSTALRLLCRLTGTEIKLRVLFAFHLAVCSCFPCRSGSRILCQLRIWMLLWLEDSILFIHRNPLLFLSLIIFTLKWEGGANYGALGDWTAATLGNLYSSLRFSPASTQQQWLTQSNT